MWAYQFIKISILIIFVTQFAQFAYASGVRVNWVENPESDVAGFNVYYGTASRNYQSYVDAGTFTSVEIDGLNSGITYYFAVTAYDSSGNESAYSQEIQATIPTISVESGSFTNAGKNKVNVGGNSGSCLISTSSAESPVFQGVIFLVLAGIVLMGIASSLRKDTTNGDQNLLKTSRLNHSFECAFISLQKN